MPAPRTRSLGRRALLAAVDLLSPTRLLLRRGTTHRRSVALTFDDGPDTTTRECLDLLDRFSARATFFVLGKACADRREDLLEILRRGHEVASHGYLHRRFPELSPDELSDELDRTAELLPPPREGRALVRPPSGAVTPGSLLRCALAGYTTVLWSLDSDDCRTRDPAEVASRVSPERVRPGEIVLLHEGQSWTMEALPSILTGLRGAGYGLVTVGDLLRS